MKVLFATSEIVPFSKTGGLADVSGALPVALDALGVEVDVFTPMYAAVKSGGFDIEHADVDVEFPVFRRRQHAFLRHTTLPDSGVRVHFVEHDRYFYRPGLYMDERGEYRDNAERFIFFCRAVIEFVRKRKTRYDVVHVNEWHTSMIPVYLRALYAEDDLFRDTAVVLSLHNIAYQGVFDQWDFNFTGLPWEYFTWRYLEFWGKMNLLKGGVAFADKLNTVSPTYAGEIQTAEFGCGIENILAARAEDLIGILNGCDYSVWNPADDEHLPANYDVDDTDGKAVCKAALQREAGLGEAPDVPLIGIVSRLAEQKGFDILGKCMDEIMDLGVQFVLLGTGQPEYEALFREARRRHAGSLSAFIKFDERLAHLIEAGCDMFLMPSRYEPCGLNQMYSMRYGTVPVVRKTGGLADTVVDYSPQALETGEATGFVFEDYTPEALLEAVRRAVALYRDDRDAWRRLAACGMRRRFGWDRSAAEYLKLYEAAVAKRRGV